MPKLLRSSFSSRSAHRRRFSPFVLVGVLVTFVIALTGGAIFLLPRAVGSHAAAALNGDCTIIVPAQPLTAHGLATPYQFMGTNEADGPCNESNPNQPAFVQREVKDPATGQVIASDQLETHQATQPSIPPVV